MKKIVFAILALMALFSCGPRDKNISIVKNEFKNYVQKTFDDPRALKEIVEIVPQDTISMKSIIGLIELTEETLSLQLELWNFKDSIENKRQETELNSMYHVKPKRRPSYSESIKFEQLSEAYLESGRKKMDAKYSLYPLRSKLNDMKFGLTYRPAIYRYEVKYRKKCADGLKLESVYAYVDSLDGFKKIVPEIDDFEVIDEDYAAVLRKNKECLSEINRVEILYDKHKEAWDEFIGFVRRF